MKNETHSFSIGPFGSSSFAFSSVKKSIQSCPCDWLVSWKVSVLSHIHVDGAVGRCDGSDNETFFHHPWSDDDTFGSRVAE